MRRAKDYAHEIRGMPCVPLVQRGIIYSTEDAIGVPKSMIHEWLKGVILRAHSSYLNQTLMTDNCRD